MCPSPYQTLNALARSTTQSCPRSAVRRSTTGLTRWATVYVVAQRRPTKLILPYISPRVRASMKGATGASRLRHAPPYKIFTKLRSSSVVPATVHPAYVRPTIPPTMLRLYTTHTVTASRLYAMFLSEPSKDAANLRCCGRVAGAARVQMSAQVCRRPKRYPLDCRSGGAFGTILILVGAVHERFA